MFFGGDGAGRVYAVSANVIPFLGEESTTLVIPA